MGNHFLASETGCADLYSTTVEEELGDTPELHVRRIVDWASEAIPKKYHAGQKEHGGCLSNKSVFKEFEGEIVDLVVYYSTHREQWERLRMMLEMAVETKDIELVHRAINLMDYGNEEGRKS